MPGQDFFHTITTSLRAPEVKVKGSRFIADIAPVSSREEIDAFLGKIRKDFFDATHHCFAYRLGADALQVRAADDGEPSGTAGRPILLVLTSQKLTNVLLVVSRYFGGTKLGTGGLARAYVEAAQQAVSMAHITRVYLTTTLTFQVMYEDLPQMERLIKHNEATIEEATYLASVNLRVAVRRSSLDHFLHAVTETFSGRVEAIPPQANSTLQ
jgi:uncharacterized YigZ family protein